MSTVLSFLPKPRTYSPAQLAALPSQTWPTPAEAIDLAAQLNDYLDHYSADPARIELSDLWHYCRLEYEVRTGSMPAVILSMDRLYSQKMKQHPRYQEFTDYLTAQLGAGASDWPPTGLAVDGALLDPELYASLLLVAQHPNDTVVRNFVKTFKEHLRLVATTGTVDCFSSHSGAFFDLNPFTQPPDPVMAAEADRVFRSIWNTLCQRAQATLAQVDYTFLLDDLLAIQSPDATFAPLDTMPLGNSSVTLDFSRTSSVLDTWSQEKFLTHIIKYKYAPVRSMLAGLISADIDTAYVTKILKGKPVNTTALEIITTHPRPSTSLLWTWSVQTLAYSKPYGANVRSAQAFIRSALEKGETLPPVLAQKVIAWSQAPDVARRCFAAIPVPIDLSHLSPSVREAYQSILHAGHGPLRHEVRALLLSARYGAELARAIVANLYCETGSIPGSNVNVEFGPFPELFDPTSPMQWRSLSEKDWSGILATRTIQEIRQLLMAKMAEHLGQVRARTKSMA